MKRFFSKLVSPFKRKTKDKIETKPRELNVPETQSPRMPIPILQQPPPERAPQVSVTDAGKAARPDNATLAEPSITGAQPSSLAKEAETVVSQIVAQIHEEVKLAADASHSDLKAPAAASASAKPEPESPAKPAVQASDTAVKTELPKAGDFAVEASHDVSDPKNTQTSPGAARVEAPKPIDAKADAPTSPPHNIKEAKAETAEVEATKAAAVVDTPDAVSPSEVSDGTGIGNITKRDVVPGETEPKAAASSADRPVAPAEQPESPVAPAVVAETPESNKASADAAKATASVETLAKLYVSSDPPAVGGVPPTPPVAKRVPIIHSHHGIEIPDDYHWLKDQTPDTKRPEIIEYLNAENEYSQAVHYRPNAALTEKIYSEIIAKINEDDESVPVFRAPYWYYSRVTKGQQYPVYARRRDTMQSPEEIILDRNTFSFEYQSLGEIEVSPDQSIVAYTLDTVGNEKFTIYLKDLESDRVREAEKIEDVTDTIVWANDSKTLFYVRMDESHRTDRVLRHTLGMTPADDVLVYYEPDPKFMAHVSKGNKYIYFGSVSGKTSETSYVHASRPEEPLRVISPRQTGHRYSVDDIDDDHFVVMTDGGGKWLSNALMICHRDATGMDHWRELLPYNPLKTLTGMTAFKSHIAVVERVGGIERILAVHVENGRATGEPEAMGFDAELYEVALSNDSEQDRSSSVVRVQFWSPVVPQQVWEYNMATRERRLLKSVAMPDNTDPSLYVMERVSVPIPADSIAKAPFNTPTPREIPVSLVYRRDMFKRDGTSPLHLYGYGSYGISIDPSYSPSMFPLLDRGIVYAIAHVRGGGDCGRAWYETGKFKHKRNTFTDFVACADELVRLGYTQHALMSMEGRSAGGLLMGAVLNLRPDLVHVAIAGVPFVDVTHTMMDASIPLTTNEYEEWGNPNDKSYFEYIYSYSPYDNVPKDVQFPHVLVKAGLNDPRVAYWEPAKWVAKMRALNVTRGNTSLLFDCKMGAGHFGVSGRYARYQEVAGDYAFLIDRIQKQQAVLVKS